VGFKIAAFPKCFEFELGLHHTMSVFDWIAMAQAELPMLEGLEMYERIFTSYERDYVWRVRDAAQAAGFPIPMYICSPDFTQPDPDARRQAIAHQAEMIQVAAWLGGEGTVCRVLSGQRRPEVGRGEGVAWVVEAIEELIPVAREHGVVLGMENHYKDGQWTRPEFAQKMDVFLEIVGAIGEREHFGVQYDPSNAIVAGDDPIALLEAVAERVVSMHASDRHLRPGATLEQLRQAEGGIGYASLLSHGVVGKGMNDYDCIFEILAGVGYDGWVSIEDGVHGLEEIRESAEFLQRMREKHFSSRIASDTTL